jgi:hypothetical protein
MNAWLLNKLFISVQLLNVVLLTPGLDQSFYAPYKPLIPPVVTLRKPAFRPWCVCVSRGLLTIDCDYFLQQEHTSSSL